MADTTRRIVIEVDLNGGTAALREIRELTNATNNLTGASHNNIAISNTLTNAHDNNSRRFAEESRHMSGLVKSYAITAANIFALSAAYNVLRENANLDVMVSASEDLSKSTGINFANVAKSMRDISNGALGIKDALQGATLAISGGATVTQLQQITEIANKAAIALGRSVPDSVNRMIQAVIKAEPELVDEFGIILRATSANEAYARSINKTVQELNSFEKQQALVSQLIEQGSNKFKDISLGGDNVNQFDRLATSAQEIIQNILSAVTGPLATALKLLSDNTTLLGFGLAGVALSIIRNMVPAFIIMGAEYIASTEAMRASTQRAQGEIQNFTYRAIDAINAERNAILGRTEALREGERILALRLSRKIPSVGEAAAAGVPGSVLTATQRVISPTMLHNALNDASNTTDRILLRTNQGIVSMTRRTAEGIHTILTDTVRTAESQLGSFSNIIRTRMAELVTFFGWTTTQTTQLMARMTVLRAGIANTLGGIFSAQTFVGALTAFSNMNLTMSRSALAAQGLSAAWITASRTIVFSVGAIGLAIRGLSTIMNSVIWPIFGIIATYQALKSFADYLGFTDKKLEEVEAKIKELDEGFAKVQDTVIKTNEVLKQNATNSQELIDKYALLGNTVKDIAAKTAEGFDAFKSSSTGSGLFGLKKDIIEILTLFNAKPLTGAGSALQTGIAYLKQLENLTGKPATVTVNIDGTFVDFMEQENINKFATELEKPGVRTAVNLAANQAIKDQIAYTTNLQGASKDLTTAITELNKSWGDLGTDFRRNNPLAQEADRLKAILNGYKVLTQEGKQVEAQLTILNNLDPHLAQKFGIDSTAAKGLDEISKLKTVVESISDKELTPSQKYSIFNVMVTNGKIALGTYTELKNILDKIEAKKEITPADIKQLELGLGERAHKIIPEGIAPKLDKQIQIDNQIVANQQANQEKLAELEARAAIAKKEAAKGGIDAKVAELNIEKQVAEQRRNILKDSLSTIESNKTAFTNLHLLYQAIQKVESSGLPGQVNTTVQKNGKISYALGKGQALPSTLLDPGVPGVDPFKPAIEENLKSFSTNTARLKRFVIEHEDELDAWAEKYFIGLANKRGIEAALKQYGGFGEVGGYTSKTLQRIKDEYAALQAKTPMALNEKAQFNSLTAEAEKQSATMEQLSIEIERLSPAYIEANARIVELTASMEKLKLVQQGKENALVDLKAQQDKPGISRAEEATIADKINAVTKEIESTKKKEYGIDIEIQKNRVLAADILDDYNAKSKALLDIEKLKGNVLTSNAAIQKSELETINKKIELTNQFIDKLKGQADLKDKELSLASDISANDKLDPNTRNLGLRAEVVLMRESYDTQMRLVDAVIAKNKYLLESSNIRLKEQDIEKYSAELAEARLDKQRLYIDNAQKEFDLVRKQNDIDKQLVDKGLKNFSDVFPTSMAIAAQEFSKSLGTSIDRVIKQITDGIDAALNTTFSNVGDFISGKKTGKQAVQGITEDLQSFFIQSATNDAKNSIKQLLLGALGGDATVQKFSTPAEETNDWLKKIYDRMSGTGSLTGSISEVANNLGTASGSNKGLGQNVFTAIGNVAGDAYKGVKNIASSISNFFDEVPAHAAGGVVTSSTFSTLAENGPEAVIPLASGAVPVTLMGNQNDSVKAMLVVGNQLSKVNAENEQQTAVQQATNMSINTMSTAIVNQLIAMTNSIVGAINGSKGGAGWSSTAASLAVAASAIGSLASAYGSASSAGGSGGSYTSDSMYGSSSAGAYNTAVTPSFSSGSYAEGGIIDRPTFSLMGEGRNSEAVVPLPNNRSIPVTLTNGGAQGDSPINMTINVVGIRDEGGLNRSANQIALESARAAKRALRRDG